MDKLSIHSILFESEVNGPGERMVIWTQGCSHGCVGCFNPETWKFTNSNLISVDELVERVISSNPDGLTISGGDPMQQSPVLLTFLEKLHTYNSAEDLCADFLPKGIICFTGYLIEELDDVALACLPYIDLLIDGRYVKELRYPSGLAGSSNQRFHFNTLIGRGESRISRDEVMFDQAVEIYVDDIDSSVIKITGFPNIDRRWLKKHGLDID